ncbi:TetR family transcriptional regulator [Nocardiopsis gilva YIM 90087]|uniref:TetR family transcriptional regulator n=1 Tax=Nocardiopsis gilva YIM 90087 TaxID=1235441 RepID=A0A223S374_9ACTN|nr:TetR/AcrR family transcriptional regulator C-terminal domain-containing protein [Nocardiopsis gilva]ASU82571.1 TetR family transcriptional regulator [Nocardiopsis gilva YIM 90087]
MTLDRETVIRAALRLLDEVGLEGLTLRRIATDLKVKAPALYWHFSSKQDLLDAMATTVLTDAFNADDGSWEELAWPDFLRDYGSTLRHALLRYRDGAKMVPGTYLTDPSMYGVMERALGVLTAAGFSPETASLALGTTYSFTVGHAIEEQGMRPRPGQQDPRYDREARRERIDPDTQPTVAALNEAAPSLATDADRAFDRGLDLIITGLAAGLAPESRSAAPHTEP